ncbi:hypothetical protein [Sphingobacterium paucimobilis]|uniref:Ig-like domain-containing protein n=1 Tax=Sphingobacterium paucimobilis HER1398 TaxID=1346330 RepID=U2J906_9SPHI|nr:hypothetical protein [Sphingobacterium paucimobilis]ERJ61414.1 hypothetical protein M472_21900 [Sphingobacterium paucimobilis HER1398]
MGRGQTRAYLTGAVNPSSNSGIYNSGLLGTGGAKLDNPEHAANATENTYASLRAEKVIALGLPLGQGDVRLHIRNTGNNHLQINKPVYFKLKEKPTTQGLSIDLGTLLGLVEGVSIKGELFAGATNPTSGIFPNPNFGTPLPNTKDQLLIDKHGEYYLSVIPPMGQTFNAARLSVEMPNTVLTVVDISSTTLRVYNVFQLETGTVCDLKPIFTDPGEQSGLNVNLSAIKLLNLGKILTNPSNAIDDDKTSFSALTPGLLSVGNYVSQTFFFNHLATAIDKVRFRVSLPVGLLNVALLNSISFQAYDVESSVGSPIQLSEDILGLDLLGIPVLGDNYTIPMEFTIRPNQRFDRIKVRFNTTLDIGGGILAGSLRIHDVSLAPSAPEVSGMESAQPKNTTICEGDQAKFSVIAVQTGDRTLTYQWQYLNEKTWSDISGANLQEVTLPNVSLSDDGRRYRVAITGGNQSCPQTIYSADAVLNVTPKLGKPHVTITNVIN